MNHTGARRARPRLLARAALAALLLIVLAWALLPAAAANALNVRAMRIALAAADPAAAPAGATSLARVAARPVEMARLRLDLARGDGRAALERGATLHPLRCDLAIHLGNAADALGDPRTADFWDDCPQIALWFGRQGDLALEAGDASAAAIWYGRAAALPPTAFDTSLPLLKLASLLRTQGWEEALPVYEEYRTRVETGSLPPLAFDQVTRRETDDWEFLAVGHHLRESDANCARAAFWYALAQRRAPANEYPPLYLGICASATEKRLNYFAQSIALNPANDRGYYWTGLTLERDGDCAGALAAYAEAAARKADEPNTFMGIARCSEASGAKAQARDAYARVLALQPGNEAAQAGLERLAKEPSP